MRFWYIHIWIRILKVKNEVVVWDFIIRKKKDAVLKIKNQKQKYMVKDFSLSLTWVPMILCMFQLTSCCDIRGATPANYTLKYNLMPYVGMLEYGEITSTTAPVPFPPVKDRIWALHRLSKSSNFAAVSCKFKTSCVRGANVFLDHNKAPYWPLALSFLPL